jgi:hydroxymethylpyrimidine/phosphomethylpyrimidine kinase
VLARGFPIRAVKTGMLGGAAQIEAVLLALISLDASVPLVVDPVMVATSGRRLLHEDSMDFLTEGLFRQAALIAPNLDEAAVLLDTPVTTRAEMEEGARELAGAYKCAVLLKGGHLEGEAADVLIEKNEVTWFEGRRHEGVHTHGTGCTLSAAITAGLAQGLALREAVARGKQFVAAAIENHFRWQKDADSPVVDALNHGG